MNVASSLNSSGVSCDLDAVHEGAVRVDVHADRPDPVARPLGGPRAPGAPQHRPEPQHELADAERLRHVVVRAELEADHAVDLLALRREHHHRHVPRARDPP